MPNDAPVPVAPNDATRLGDSPAVSIAQACELLGVSRPTVYALVKRGELNLFKVGRCSRLNRRQVLALVGEGGDA